VQFVMQAGVLLLLYFKNPYVLLGDVLCRCGRMCGSGEIGRHTILRGWRRKAWGFKSPLPHHHSPGSRQAMRVNVKIWAGF